MTDATAAALTRMVARDDLDALAVRVAELRDEVARWCPDDRIDLRLAIAHVSLSGAIERLSRPTTRPLCACGHGPQDHLIQSAHVTVCDACGCPGWTPA